MWAWPKRRGVSGRVTGRADVTVTVTFRGGIIFIFLGENVPNMRRNGQDPSQMSLIFFKRPMTTAPVWRTLLIK